MKWFNNASAMRVRGFNRTLICGITIVGATSFLPAAWAQDGSFNLLPSLKETQILSPTGGTFNDGFGQSLAVDGDTLVVGSNRNAPNFGRATFVFIHDGKTWVEQAKLTGPNSFGYATAISGDTLVVGDHRDSNGGRIYVYARSGTNWGLQARLTGSDIVNGDQFGSTVSIDGDTIIAGAPYKERNLTVDQEGVVYVFGRQGTNWTQTQRIMASDTRLYLRFGGAVSIDGDHFLVGAPGSYNAAYTFVRNGNTWSEEQKLNPSPIYANAAFGQTVLLKGNTAVVGATADRPVPTAFVFVHNGSSWVQQARLTGTDTGSSDRFGSSLALQGDVLAVGAQQDNSNQGSVYVFAREGTSWTQQTRLAASNERGHTFFGISVAVHGQNVLAGSLNGDSAIAGSGAVYSFEPNIAGLVRAMLYYPEAAAGSADPELAAFRYKHWLYGMGTNGVRPRFEIMSDLYGQAERDRAAEAIALLVTALPEDPTNETLGNLLLDIYYDRTVAEAILAKDVLAQAEVARFGPPLALPVTNSSGFLIDNEIPLYEQVLAANRAALQDYYELLSDDLGVPGEPPLGYVLFRDFVPMRGLTPATYTNETGTSVSVATNESLFDGHKDTVLLFELLTDHGEVAAALGRLLFSRNNPGDVEAARERISQAQQFIFLQGNLLKNIFPSLPAEGDPSGLAEVLAAWNSVLLTLADLQQVLIGRANPLGFDSDFLMLAERISSGSTNFFDSFDSFAFRLRTGSTVSPLSVALADLAAARASYGQYRGYEDQLREQYDQSTVSYESRLRDIVGAFPDDTENYSDNPTKNSGSELDQQYRSIELAKLRIQRNKAEISNLRQQVEIEVGRAASISNVFLNFGGQRASIAAKLGHINAVQAGANALSQALSVENLTKGLFVGFLVNAAVQAGAEEMKSQLEAEKEQLAGLEQAQIEGINSAATVKTLMLQMNTLAVDSQEASLLLQQEMARLAALYREKQQLEAYIQRRNRDLATRYFADPIHRITSETSLIRANLSFEDAQKWLFFLSQAFYYKWNTPFTNNAYLGRNWDATSVFKARHAEELNDLYLALLNKDSVNGDGLNRDDLFTSFSVRKDFFGFVDGQTYADPETLEPLSPLEAFRRKLLRSVVTNFSDIRVEVDFSTVREKIATSFFLGPRFRLDGSVASPGRYLDKIVWLKIKVPGQHTTGFNQVNGDLTYGGTSFVRRQNVGRFRPDQLDRVQGEMTAFSTRFWFFDTQLDRYRFNEGFISSGVQIELSPDPEVPPSVSQINDFTERSVAASNWHLSLPIRDRTSGQDLIRIEDMEDILIYFFHQSISRQLPSL